MRREMEAQLATAQAFRYAEELGELHAAVHRHRRETTVALGRLDASQRLTVYALAATLELRDDETAVHSERVTELGLELARVVAPGLVDDRQLEYGFLLHDLGKIGIPDSILRKRGTLDRDEMDAMRNHPALGEQIVALIPYLDGLARDVVVAHHERWDGKGYPHGLAGTEIPLAARIFSVVDAFDAMTSDRPYRRALPIGAALDEIATRSGTQFDPKIADAFVPVVGGRVRRGRLGVRAGFVDSVRTAA